MARSAYLSFRQVKSRSRAVMRRKPHAANKIIENKVLDLGDILSQPVLVTVKTISNFFNQAAALYLESHLSDRVSLNFERLDIQWKQLS